jgi:PAS domain S-box-containing protein
VLHELVYEKGVASDYRILDANPAFERETGLSREEVRGGLASEVYGSAAAPYLAEYASVAEGGEPLSFETYFAPLERHFRIAAVAPAPGRFATIFEDITERKRAEEELTALYESQRDVALTLQRSFLHRLPQFDGLEAALIEVPASEPDLVGGDLWDLFELPDGRKVAVIGDVAGKGVVAAGLAWTVRSAIHASALMNADPALILRNVNRLLLGQGVGEQFVTALVVVIDGENRELTMASAGHPAPVHLSAGLCAMPEPLYGPPLGAFAADYVSSTESLAGGDYLVLFTDGLSEARHNGELFGDERLIETIRELYGVTSEQLAATVKGAAEDFAGRLRDDLDVMVLRLR